MEKQSIEAKDTRAWNRLIKKIREIIKETYPDFNFPKQPHRVEQVGSEWERRMLVQYARYNQETEDYCFVEIKINRNKDDKSVKQVFNINSTVKNFKFVRSITIREETIAKAINKHFERIVEIVTKEANKTIDKEAEEERDYISCWLEDKGFEIGKTILGSMKEGRENISTLRVEVKKNGFNYSISKSNIFQIFIQSKDSFKGLNAMFRFELKDDRWKEVFESLDYLSEHLTDEYTLDNQNIINRMIHTIDKDLEEAEESVNTWIGAKMVEKNTPKGAYTFKYGELKENSRINVEASFRFRRRTVFSAEEIYINLGNEEEGLPLHIPEVYEWIEHTCKQVLTNI